MKITKSDFGKTKAGEQATLFTIENKNGVKVSFTDYGATIVGIFTPDRNGKIEDIALGYDSVNGYAENGTYYGAFIGRNGNRIANAEFSINGTKYTLDKNDRVNNLHGGFKGYNNFFYESEIIEDTKDEITIEFSRLSPDMEQGFPGNLDVTVSYTLTEENELIIEYYAVSDKDTVCNLTNHTFFNLDGQASGSILDTMMYIDADHFTPTDNGLIPTGELRDVTGTPMDFRVAKRIGERIEADYEPLKQGGGYDHNYCLNNSGEDCEFVCEAYSEKSGRKVEVYTDLPGMQLYVGNFIDGKVAGKGGYVYKKREGFCLETQLFPDACHEKPYFKSSIIKAGEAYESATVYKFGIVED